MDVGTRQDCIRPFSRKHSKTPSTSLPVMLPVDDNRTFPQNFLKGPSRFPLLKVVFPHHTTGHKFIRATVVCDVSMVDDSFPWHVLLRTTDQYKDQQKCEKGLHDEPEHTPR